MTSLLVIGGSGFFGKSILDAYGRGVLSPWGIESVIIMARNADALKKSNPELLFDSVKLVNCDLTTCLELPTSDYVIHAAASSDEASYLEYPDAEKENIRAGAKNYSYLAKKFHKNSRILYCSSGAVYGVQPADLEHVTEDFQPRVSVGISNGKSAYAAAKYEAEGYIRTLETHGCLVSIARCFSFVGKHLPLNKHFAVGNFIQDGILGRPINVKATHTVYRSYMYADDLVRWLMTICANSQSRCQIYNVGSNEVITISELANLIAHRFSVDINITAPTDRKIDRYIPSINKAKSELGLSLSFDIHSAIHKTIDAICDSPHAPGHPNFKYEPNKR